MSEVSKQESVDIKTSKIENYKDIKPDSDLSVKESAAYWEKQFKNDSEYENSDGEKNNISKDIKNNSELNDAEKNKIRKETGWSEKVIDNIKNMDQFKIYKEANLVEKIIDGRPCLVKKDLDLDYVSEKTKDDKHPDGISNHELMKDGKSPYDSKTGEKIELHHMGQGFYSPLVELCENSEHGDGNHGVLHDSKGESWRKVSKLKNTFNNEQKPNHWKERGAS